MAETGTVSTAEAVALLAFESPADFLRVMREIGIKPDAGNDRWRTIPLVQQYARHARWRASVATTNELASCWGLTTKRVGQLATEAGFKLVKRGYYDRNEADAAYIRFLRDQNKRNSKSETDSRVREARALDIEQRTAERARRLIRIEEAEDALTNVVGIIRTELTGMPARVSRDMATRREIEKAIDESLARVCTRLAAEIAALRTGVATSDAATAVAA
jgi:hypothetical protein